MICPWALKDEFLKTYHDEEWCRPHHDDTYLFEMLVLESAQAGLSWSTILKRREGYRKTFFHFDISRCAGMTDEEMEEIGYDDYFFGNGICLIEWAELIEEILPDNVISITIEKDLTQGFDYRKITVDGL